METFGNLILLFCVGEMVPFYRGKSINWYRVFLWIAILGQSTVSPGRRVFNRVTVFLCSILFRIENGILWKYCSQHSKRSSLEAYYSDHPLQVYWHSVLRVYYGLRMYTADITTVRKRISVSWPSRNVRFTTDFIKSNRPPSDIKAIVYGINK